MNLSNTKWTAIGPAPTDTPTVGLGFSAGRIEVAAPDPTNADVMYIGANGGGVWKTGVWNNPSPVWLPVTDDQPSLNFAGYHCLVVHPGEKESHSGTRLWPRRRDPEVHQCGTRLDAARKRHVRRGNAWVHCRTSHEYANSLCVQL